MAINQSRTELAIVLALFFVASVLIGLLLFLVEKNKRDLLNRSGIDKIDGMSGIEFEKYLKALLERRGYSSVRLTTTYDLGVDLIAKKGNETWAIQAKRYKNMVGLDAVRQVVAATAHYKCDRAMVITNSYFTNNAQKIAKSSNCELIDRTALINLILQDDTIQSMQ